MSGKNTRLFLCRHGETEWSLSGQHTGRTDLSLTERGREQAKGLKEFLHSLPIDRVVCSPLTRAKETCALAGFSSPIIDPRVVEWDYGEYEGLTRAQIELKHKGWNLVRDGAPGGEMPGDVERRVDLFLESVLGGGENILLFSHGHFLKTLAARWVGLRVEQAACFSLVVASLSILDWEHQRRVIALWNQRSNGELPRLNNR